MVGRSSCARDWLRGLVCRVLTSRSTGVHAATRKLLPMTAPDAVGTLVSVDARSLVVDTRRGSVTIERSLVVAAKVVPPRPSRRGAPHLALSVEHLQRVMVQGWAPVEQARLGDWVLRAAGGFTGRANSVLPLGDPGLPLPAAVARAEDWYAARGLPARFLVAGPVGFAVAEDRLGSLLLGRGYRETDRSVVMTAAAQ